MEGSRMKIDVNGQQVEVEDGFADLSPEEQQATVDEISKSLIHHSEAKQETVDQAQVANVPPAATDLSNPQSTARQITDPALAVGQTALEHPGAVATGAAVVSALPGVRNIPPFKQVNETRQILQNLPGKAFNLMQGQAPASPAVGPIAPGPASSFQPGTGTKVPITSQPMPQAAPQAAPQPPTAQNYIQRMDALSKQYGPAQQAITSTYKGAPIRGGGGGGGGMNVYDPTNRRKPLQF